MSEQHPKVQAARAAEELIRQRLHGERAAAINGLKAELQLSTTRAEQLERQLTEVIGRMNRLAGLRAQYGNLIAEVRQRSEMLNKARHELSEAQATQASAHSASLITLLDSPVVGTRPVGPSKELIALAGLLGGLLTGWGMVFLTVPTPSPALATAVNAPVPPPATGRRTASAPPAGHGLSLKKALTRLAQGIFVWN
jgi:uncharacterized protein involved in exopolysaccharide biosynthesis